MYCLTRSTFSHILGASILCLSSSIASAGTTAPPFRIHCGGEAFHDQNGHLWEADGHFLGGQTFLTAADISGTTDMALFRTERWNDPAGENLKYSFDVPEGD